MINLEPGSSLYYSLLWTDNDTKERYVQRLTLLQSLNNTLDDVQDPQVAQQKIHWWHEELERMLNSEARHPATQACQGSFASSSSQFSDATTNPIMLACLALLSSVSDARFTPPATMKDRDEQLIKNFTARLALMSHALSNDLSDLKLTSHSAIAAEGLAKHEQLIRLPALLHRGHAAFSDDTYKFYKITPGDLAAGVRVSSNTEPTEDYASVAKANRMPGGGAPPDYGKSAGKMPATGSLAATNPAMMIPIVEDKPGKQLIIKAAIEDTHAALLKASIHPEVSSRYRHEPLLPLWRMIILRRKQLALWEHKQPNLLREHMTLTPLGKFFHAWRNRR